MKNKHCCQENRTSEEHQHQEHQHHAHDTCCSSGESSCSCSSKCEEESQSSASSAIGTQENASAEQPEATIAELTDTLQRLQAEFDNYKKRIDREKKEFMLFANRELIKNVLPILDNLTLALQHQGNFEEFQKGVVMIHTQLSEILREQGLEPIETKGKPFDPHVHEALLQIESTEPSGTVLEELQKGYILVGTVLRPAKVKVSKGKADGGVQHPQQQRD